MSPKPLRTREERHLFFRKMVLTLVIPYLLWALIYSDFNFPNVGWILYGSRVSLAKAASVTSLLSPPPAFFWALRSETA